MMTFLDLVKGYLYKMPKQGGGYRYIYPGSGDRKRPATGKKESSKKRNGKKKPPPPVADDLSAIPFDGQPFDAATFAALGKVVATSSDRRVVRDRFGGLWGLRDGHLVKL